MTWHLLVLIVEKQKTRNRRVSNPTNKSPTFLFHCTLCKQIYLTVRLGFMAKFEAKTLLKDKKFWIASFIITWAAALQGHMMWLQRQDSFKEKFGSLNQNNNGDEQNLPS